MDVSAVIAQLRQYCPALALVGGAADFASGLETVVNPASLPAGFVIPSAEDADDNELQNALRQEVRERVGVIIEFDNTTDRRGQAASNQVDAMKYSLFSALLNWRIDPFRAQKGLQYSGGRFIDMDRGRLWWQFDFELIVNINDEDGFQIPTIDLTDIQVEMDIDQQPVAPPPPEIVEVDIFLYGGESLGQLAGTEAASGAGEIVASSDVIEVVAPLDGTQGVTTAGTITAS